MQGSGAIDPAHDDLVLLPRPRRLTRGEGVLTLDPGGGIPSTAGPEVVIRASAGIPAQGYRLVVAPRGITIEAADPAGAFYARATLDQLGRAGAPAGAVPAVTIEDAPDLDERGVMIDVSRDKVPTMGTLYRLVDELASFKINRLQLYMEHTFAYRAHPSVWAAASPMTADEIESLDAYCRERFIELVPNQNSFGHMERWLKRPEYAHLAEIPGGSAETMSLCAVDPRAVEFVAGLYDELLPHFTSRAVNVGCDETTDLGKGRSREEVERRGVGRVYLDFLLKIHALVRERGRRMQFWGDIVLEHPELIGELPRDAVALNWGYEADHPFDAEGARFAAAGVPYQVCPGTSAWLSLAGRTGNAIANLASAAAAAGRHRAAGMLVTDWGDLGHWQPYPVSTLGLAYGAAVAWGLPANRDLDVPRALDLQAFRDGAGVLGHVAHDLGDVHRETGVTPKNASVLALLMLFPERALGEGRLSGLTVEGLERASARADEVTAPLTLSRPDRDDGALLKDEFALAADLVRHGCALGIARLTAPGGTVGSIAAARKRALADDLGRILDDYRRIWRARNREGGLAASAARLETLLALYRS
jgi:hexosaminidase